MRERHDQSNHSGAQRPDPHQPQNAVTRSMRIRAGVVAGALVVFFGLLVYVLTTYQIRDTEKYSSAAINQQMADETIAPNRGTIYDANMKVLAQSSPVWNVVASPRDLHLADTDTYKLAAELASMLDLDAESVLAKLTKQKDLSLIHISQQIRHRVRPGEYGLGDERYHSHGRHRGRHQGHARERRKAAGFCRRKAGGSVPRDPGHPRPVSQGRTKLQKASILPFFRDEMLWKNGRIFLQNCAIRERMWDISCLKQKNTVINISNSIKLLRKLSLLCYDLLERQRKGGRGCLLYTSRCV